VDPSDVLPSGTPDYQSPRDNEVLIEPDVQASTLDITGPEAFSPSLSHSESSSNSDISDLSVGESCDPTEVSVCDGANKDIAMQSTSEISESSDSDSCSVSSFDTESDTEAFNAL